MSTHILVLVSHTSGCEINHPLHQAYIGCASLTGIIDLRINELTTENILDQDYQEFRSHWYDAIMALKLLC